MYDGLGASSGASRVSLGENYDGRRVVNTPLSLHACNLEGVDPWSLTIHGRPRGGGGSGADDGGGSAASSQRNRSSARGGAAAGGAGSARRGGAGGAAAVADALFDGAVARDREMQQLKEQFMEKRREQLLASVMRTYKQLTSPRNTLPPPPLSLSGKLPDMTVKQEFSRKPKSVTSTLRSLARTGDGQDLEATDASDASARRRFKSATVLSAENSQEVARHFVKLQTTTEKNWRANLVCETRDRETRQHVRDQVQQRREDMSARAQARDEHLERTQHHHDDLMAARRANIEQRMQKEQERMERVLARKRQLEEEARERGRTRGESQRASSMRREAERLQRIADRKQDQADNQAEASLRRQREDALRAFERELQTLAQRDTAARASRAGEYKKEMFDERVRVGQHRERQRRNERDDRFHDDMVQRDAVHRMKESLDGFFGQLPRRPADVSPRYSTTGEPGGDFKVQPPNKGKQSSAQALGTLTSARKAATARLPQIEPPTWLQQEVVRLQDTQRLREDAASERRVVIEEGGGGNSSKKEFKRATHERRWPFTAPESTVKLAQPRWMMQGDE